MELRQYIAILRRRWWLIVALPALVLVISLLTYTPTASTYQYVIRLAVGVEPIEQSDVALDNDPLLAAAQASEYIADDLSVIVGETAFAEAVNARLPEDMQVPAGTLAGQSVADKQHRILTLTITWSNPDQLAQIGDAAVETLREDGGDFVTLLSARRSTIHVIGRHGPFPVGPGLRQQLDIPLRVIIAAVAAVVLAFVWDYLDDSIRTRDEVERLLGCDVLAEVPGERGFRLRG